MQNFLDIRRQGENSVIAAQGERLLPENRAPCPPAGEQGADVQKLRNRGLNPSMRIGEQIFRLTRRKIAGILDAFQDF